MKKIGILGSGAVARTLGKGFLDHGYEVMLGSRTPSKLDDWKSENPIGLTGTFEQTAKFGELLVLAAKGTMAIAVLEQAGAANLKGKCIMDTTNPIAPEPPVDGVLKFSTTLDYSLMEKLQEQFPDAHFVKAFNSVGSPRMVNPSFPEGKPTMFICGNAAKAKAEASKILLLFGWEVADLGKATAARAIEPLCILWCIPGFLENKWTHAFKVLGL